VPLRIERWLRRDEEPDRPLPKIARAGAGTGGVA
jgi:hypothetical protein